MTLARLDQKIQLHKYARARLQETLLDRNVGYALVIGRREGIVKQEHNGSKCCNGWEITEAFFKKFVLYFPVFI